MDGQQGIQVIVEMAVRLPRWLYPGGLSGVSCGNCAVVKVMPARRDDVVAIAGLLEEMNRFYGAAGAGQLKERVREITEALFTDPPAAYALVAWHQAQLVGIAAYSFMWPAARLSRSLYLKELYVSEAYRNQGAGKLLMQALFQQATPRSIRDSCNGSCSLGPSCARGARPAS
jgi:GNAT superfamily N-acetyltransferase